jgi:RNA polymerase sigma factor (sigma-70 family)
MVLQVCRRVLGDAHTAEDVFQAVFLVLARKASSLRRPDAVAGWLHGVAQRLAWKARADDVRRRHRETPILRPDLVGPAVDPLEELSARELLCLLDNELQRLPEAYRLPLILCCLEGHTQEEAARELRLSIGRQIAFELLQELGRSFPAAIGCVVEDVVRVIRVTQIDPEPAHLGFVLLGILHRHRRVIGVNHS